MGPSNRVGIQEDCTKWSMGCGNCGCETFTIFQKKGTIVVKCTKCKGESIITISAELVIDLDKAKDNDGCLARTPENNA